jgi:alpha-mannosidase
LPLRNGWVFSYIFNNYWFTNYKAGQKLSQTFRYVITSGRKMDAVAAARKSWEADYPVRAIGVEKASEDAQMPPEGTLCTVDEPNVFITTVKPAEDGQGFIVRLLEVAGTKTNAHLKLGLLKARKAFRCTLVEEPMEELKIENGMVSVEMPQRGIATIRLE